MFSLWKNPLKKKFSPEELHRIHQEYEEKSPDAGSFIGASLLDKTACVLPVVNSNTETRYVIAGEDDTLARVTPILLARQAVEKHQSILFVDFASHDPAIATEPSWHKLWALSFYLDRARNFRLFDLGHAERSDTLGSHLPASYHSLLPHLAKTQNAVDPAEYLQNEKGIVIFAAGGTDEKQGRDLLFDLTSTCLPKADLAIILHADSLEGSQQKTLGELAKSTPVIMHARELAEPNLTATAILFRQRNSLPAHYFSNLQQRAHSSLLAKTLNELDSHLKGLQFNQAFFSPQSGKAALDLIQISDTDGLPWPPEYRPLSLRHPGT